MAQHKWHKEIKAWADGAEIEWWHSGRGEWITEEPRWLEDTKYRIKPQPKEQDELFEKFWNTEIISAVTGNIDRLMWGNIDKDNTQSIFNCGRRYERESQKMLNGLTEEETNSTMSVKGLSPTRLDYSIATIPIQTFTAPTEPTHVKEPQYLYVYEKDTFKTIFIESELMREVGSSWNYIGKIKLEVDE